MRNHFSLICVFLIIIAPFTVLSSTINQTNPTIVDYIYCNSNIITIDDSNTIFEAIAIKDGIIVALGSNEDILSNYEAINNQCYNLEGRTIMPGIIDGHTHYMASLFWLGDTANIYDAQNLALSHGYTTLNEKSVDGGELAWFQEAEQNDNLRLRVNCFLIYNYAFLDENNETILVDHWPPDMVPVLDNHLKLRIPGIKFYTDGAGGNRGHPAMTIAYSQEMIDAWGARDPYGNLYFNQTVLNATVDAIHDRGFICAFHSMGDRAIQTVLNSLEYALNGSTDEYARHQIEHNSFIRGDLITKSQNLDTVHSIRGYFPTYWQKEYEELFNSTWQAWYMNRYSLPGLEIHSYLETDFTWNGFDPDNLSHTRNINPFLHLWGLVTRKAIDENGTIHEPDPWTSNHTITVEQALRMMTIEGAYAVKQEDYIGSLEVGKYADMIILTADPLTINPDDLKDIEVMLTMIDGKIEYMIASHSFPLPYNPPTTNPSDTEPTSWIVLLSIVGLTSITFVRRFRK